MELTTESGRLRDAQLIFACMMCKRYLYHILESSDKYPDRAGQCLVENVRYNSDDDEFYYSVRDFDTGLRFEIGSPYIYFESVAAADYWQMGHYDNDFAAKRIKLFMKNRKLSYYIASPGSNNGKQGICMIERIDWYENEHEFIYVIKDVNSGETYRVLRHCLKFDEPED